MLLAFSRSFCVQYFTSRILGQKYFHAKNIVLLAYLYNYFIRLYFRLSVISLSLSQLKNRFKKFCLKQFSLYHYTK
jgi:hypothetical protein